MRTRRGKLVAVVAGVVVVVLLTMVAALFWRDFYCHLFLDPRLVGRWRGHVSSSLPSEHEIEFDKLGNVSVTSIEHPRPAFRLVSDKTGTYGVEGQSLAIVWSDGTEPPKVDYQIAGASLVLEWSSNSEITYQRAREQ